MLVMTLAITGAVYAEQAKPNVVIIFTDDQGWSDVGYQGNEYYETPNIDRLAAQSLVFETAHSQAAYTRASFNRRQTIMLSAEDVGMMGIKSYQKQKRRSAARWTCRARSTSCSSTPTALGRSMTVTNV
mgnify:CR=1 FL=1